MKAKKTPVQKFGAIVHEDALLDDKVIVWHGAQVAKGAKIGKNTIIGNNVYVDSQVIIGKNCKIQSGTSIFAGVVIKDGVFIGPHVCFTNDKYPKATNQRGQLIKAHEWKLSKTVVMSGSSIGANSTILPGIKIGKNAMVGAGSVVTKSIPENALAYGNPAKVVGKVDAGGKIILHKNDK